MMAWDNFRNYHAGETGLILGCGPSLNVYPSEFLTRYPSIGLNRVYLKIIPDYLVAVEPVGMTPFMGEVDALDCVKFLNEQIWRPGALKLVSTPGVTFSTDPSNGCYEGYTVTYVALQIAYYMGFSTVLLAGVDHRYDSEPVHFSPEYTRGMQYRPPRSDKTEEAYKLAETVYRANGRRVYNITPGSALDVFEHRDWRDYA